MTVSADRAGKSAIILSTSFYPRALINLVALAFAPEGRDVDAEGFVGVLERRRLGDNAHNMVAFHVIENGVGAGFRFGGSRRVG